MLHPPFVVIFLLSFQHGGKFVQNPGSGTHCVIADRINVRVKNVIRYEVS